MDRLAGQATLRWPLSGPKAPPASRGAGGTTLTLPATGMTPGPETRLGAVGRLSPIRRRPTA